MLARIHQLGGNLVFIQPVSATDPGFGNLGGGVDPGFGHPTFPHPGHGLPGSGGHPSHGLPGSPGTPGNELPTTPPPAVPAGTVVVLVRDASGKWHYAALQPGSPPPRPLPEPTPPPVAGTPLPPTAAPKA